MATKKKPAAPVQPKRASRKELEKRREDQKRAEKRIPDNGNVFRIKRPKKSVLSPALTGLAMTYGKDISDIDQKTKEGRLLIAALAILTTSKSIHLAGKDRPGDKMTPFQVLDKIKALAEDIYKDAPTDVKVASISIPKTIADELRSGKYTEALLVDKNGTIWGKPAEGGKMKGFSFNVLDKVDVKLDPVSNLQNFCSNRDQDEKSPIDFASDFCRGLNLYPAGKQNDILREVVSTIKNRNGMNLERTKQRASEAAVALQISEQIVRENESQAKAQDLILSGSYDALRLEGSEED